MNPLVELESFYIATRRQAESGMMPVDEAVSLVNARTITDAAGVIWRVDVNASTPTKAAFLSGFPGQEPRPSDPSSFAASTNQQAPQVPPSGSYQMAQPYSGVPPQAPQPLAPIQRGPQPTQPQKKESKEPRAGRLSGIVSAVSEKFAVTPKMVTALVGLFVVLAAAYAFIKMRSGSDEPAGQTTVPTSSVASTTSTVLVPSTPPPTSPPETTAPPETVPQETTIPPLAPPGSDQTTETIPSFNP